MCLNVVNKTTNLTKLDNIFRMIKVWKEGLLHSSLIEFVLAWSQILLAKLHLNCAIVQRFCKKWLREDYEIEPPHREAKNASALDLLRDKVRRLGRQKKGDKFSLR